MRWNIITITPVISFILYVGLFFIINTATPQTDIRRSFRLYLANMVIWSVSGFLVLQDISFTLFWARIMTANGIWAMANIYFFSINLLEKKRKWHTYIPVYLILFAILTLFSNYVVETVSVVNNVVEEFVQGPLAILGFPGYFLFPLALYELIFAQRSTNDIIQKNRLTYLVLGVGISFLGTLINFTPLKKYPIEVGANVLTALLITYAILRHQLLDIRVVIRQGLLYSIPTVLIGTTYFLIITFFLQVFEPFAGVNIFITSLIVAVIAALIVEPLRVQAQNIIDKLFFREKYDSSLMLQTLSSSVASILNLYKITRMILEEVCSTLHIPMAAFFLRDEETNEFQLTTQIGQESIQYLGFRQNHPMILWLSTHEKPLTRRDMELLPQFQSLWRNERDDLEKLAAELFIPIKVQKTLVGIFLVRSKRSEQAYNPEDILTLTTVANQTAVAIENARLYTAEQSRRKEIDTLYNLSHQLVVTDDPETILKGVTQHAAESIQVTYARILIRESNGDYYCRAIYPEHNLAGPLRLGKIEPIVAEHYYNQILRHGKSVVLDINNPDWQKEEKQALFINHASTLCLCPLKGADAQIGLLILGEFHSNQGTPFSTADLRLINAITDYAASAIQRAMLHEQLEENFLQTVVSLANAIDARDAYTGDHSQRMGDMATRVSQAMKLSEKEVESVYWAAVLHDIGKLV